MPVWRLTAVLAPVSGDPADAVTNSWHFRAAVGDATAEDIDILALRVAEFYAGPAGVSAEPGMSADIAASIADGGHQVRCYLYDEVTGLRTNFEGAPPEHVSPFDFDADRGTEQLGLAQETALKVTLRATNSALVNVPLARRTGGVYFGPVETLAGSAGDGNFNVPSAAFRLRLHDEAQALVEAAAVDGRRMVVWSRPYEGRAEIVRPGRPTLPALPARDGALYDVDQLFTDDEWDTVRRRGRRQGARSFRTPDITP